MRTLLLQSLKGRSSGKFVSLRKALLLFVISLVVGTFGFTLIEDYPIGDALYMAIITISTVGFEEVKPLSSNGQIFASFYIIFNIGVFAYSISAFSVYVVHGEIFKTIKIQKMERKIRALKDHIIICGHGKYGKEVRNYFLLHKMDIVIIDLDQKTFEDESDSLLYIVDDTTKDDVLIQAGIEHARSIITVLPDDTENLYTVMAARALNPNINIISRAVHDRAIAKLKLGGANHVIMPTQIGGYFMATLESKPNAVEFFSYLTNETLSDIRYAEIRFKDFANECIGKSIKNLKIRSVTGVNILATMSEEGKYNVNPDPKTVITEDTNFIILGTEDQINAFHNYVKSYKA
jgi:voltage-gated potassium channel